MDKAYKKVEELSGGERQRVAIARALVQGARVIFADEPFSGLDPRSTEQIMKDFQYLAQKVKVTVLCSLHNVELAERFATKMWGIRDGKLVMDVAGRKLTVLEKNKIFS
ncbi:ATP-binding cassette domain-containing protein [Paenibacillus larvae]|uniref:ATP-binding cassette domain-containing protein n=1 Tax=Paenibacillus larvae TaxID=1464 RepID=UPI001EEEA652|nr:ATP-binding cassette domain-containing protein [Paenibacillus larvae]